ncbi:hypothetical protein [Halorussus halophilus]|uniref:hypothetical protein n=1 Tax=Halorussus halophilus TaxID=2650975 RepID=UPI001301677C|nr:hypothetical protein [Halorussus halophilus]
MNEENDIDPTELFSGTQKAGDEIDAAEGSLPKGEKITPAETFDNDRPRGILSEADRDYLCGEKEYKHAQSEANRRQEIRERITNGLEDFILLWVLLDERERTKIFEEMGDNRLKDSLAGMVAFTYLGLDQDADRLEDIIENGVYFGSNIDESGRWAGEAIDVDASIDIEYNPDVGGIYKRFKEGKGHQLTPAEIGVLVREGKLDGADINSLEGSWHQPPFSKNASSNDEDEKDS